MKYNVKKLHEELKKAGIDVVGVNEDGKVFTMSPATMVEKKKIEDIKFAHDPHDYREERAKKHLNIGDQLDAIYHFFKSKGWEVPGFTDEIDKVKSDIPKN
jgi:hypothetical protein